MDKKGIDFIDKLYKNLYMSDEVQHTKENSDKKREAIQKYFDRLERIHKKADTDSKKRLIESLYYDKYVIKIPDYYTEEVKDVVIEGQKKSLKKWIDYLSNPTAIYPTWAKYWAFQGMLKMGNYDELKGVYTKRNDKTESPFIDCNPEIVAKCIEAIIKIVNNEPLDSDLMASKTDSFSKLYTMFEKKYRDNVVEKSESTDGIWIKYNKGNKEDAIKLCKSLDGKNTHWCTASEEMAIKQVCGPYETKDGGDFYVYYTKDKNGEYTIPRIAIRLNENDRIGEIRGIEDGQNLEESMMDVLEIKLNEMTFVEKEDIDKNIEIVNDLKKLQEIGEKTNKNEMLSQEEIIDLYLKKYGFGWIQDPRVDKIIKMRNVTEDLKMLEDKTIKMKIISEGNITEYSIDDEDLILESVKEDGRKLYFASKRIRNIKDIVLVAVKENGYVLELASEELRNDKEVALAAVTSYGRSIKFVGNKLKYDLDIIKAALIEDESAYYNISFTVLSHPYYGSKIKRILEEIKKNKAQENEEDIIKK